MALSHPRPDPTSPASVASAGFGTARKGFDPTEVRDFLQQVAAELARLQDQQRATERELAQARQATPPAIEELDEGTITSMLGEETARVLSTAREAAAQIRAKAEEGATRLLLEAQDEAARVREQSELDAARRRQDASAEAEAALEHARAQGRDMVAETKEYRERVLADLTKRREQARQQLQQLAGGRDRLVQAFDQARRSAEEVLGELDEVGGDPEELAGPVTGPVPVVPVRAPVAPTPDPPVSAAPAVASASHAEPDVEPVTDTAELDVEPEVVESEVVEPEVVEPEVDEAAEPLVDEAAEPLVDEADDAEVVSGSELDVAPDQESDQASDREPDEAPELAPVVALFAGELDTDVRPPAAAEPITAKSSVDDLFARLKAARTDEIATEVGRSSSGTAGRTAATAITQPVPVVAAAPAAAPAGAGDADDAETAAAESAPLDEFAESPFVARDEALAPIELDLARKFKRALADEQNELLDVLRRKEPVRALDQLLPAVEDHLAPYLDAVRDELPAAARAGARSVSQDDPARLDRRLVDAAVVERSAATVGPELVEPLRELLARSVAGAGGDNGALAADARSIYREWKTQRLDEFAAALARAAYARGAYAALVPGTPVRWVADPGASRCAQTHDNEASGVVRAGDVFPSGDACPPTDSQCRCLLVIADR